MAPMGSVDLSADLGEIEGQAGRDLDAALMAALSTAHLACGGHAGDVVSMTAGIDAALRHGVAIGAHPSYADRAGFGRRRHEAPLGEVVEAVLEQIGALEDLARGAGAVVRSIKPHGALYHDLSEDQALADALFSALRTRDGVIVLAAGSRAAQRASAAGLTVIEEAFCDRRYDERGTLVSRAAPHALIEDPQDASKQAVTLATEGLWGSGRHIASLCLHSDHQRSLEIAHATRAALDAAGIAVAAP